MKRFKQINKYKSSFSKVFISLITIAMTISFFNQGMIEATENDWNISLNWGDSSEGLPSDYNLNVDKEGNYTVKVQASIEYTGADSKTYAPEEVQIKISDLYGLTGMSYYNANYMSIDISAEEKGSGSGRGDWYYTRTFNEETKANDYVFTNKNAINSSFTSTFQMVFTFSNVRNYLNSSFTQGVSAILSDGTFKLSSNTLNFNFATKKDTYALQFNTPGQLGWPNAILSQIPTENWNDYIFIDLPIKASFDEYNSTPLQKGYHLDLNLPEDVISVLYDTRFDEGDLCLFSGSNISQYPSIKINFNYNILNYALALPRDKYLQLGTLNIDANWYGTYVGYAEEELVAQDSILLNINEFDYFYTGELYSSEKYSDVEYDIYYEAMQYGYGKTELVGNTQKWRLNASSVYYGTPYNLIIGDDLQYFIYEDNSFRQLSDDERVINSVKMTNPTSSNVTAELWLKQLGSNTYTKYSTYNLKPNASASIRLTSTVRKYSEMYVKFLDLNETVQFGKYVEIETRLFDNTALDNGKTIKNCYNLSYVEIELLNDDSSVKETVIMEDFGFSNIPGLAEAVNELDHLDGDTKLRATDKVTASGITYGTQSSITSSDKNVSSDDENVYLMSGVVEHTLQISSELDSTIEDYSVTYTYPSTLKLAIDKVLFTQFGDNSYNSKPKYTLSEVQELDHSVITYDTVVNSDGTVSTTFHFDLKNITTDYVASNSTNYLYQMNLAFYTSLDDYYLLDLDGTNARLVAGAPKSDSIYNLCTDLYYTPMAYSSGGTNLTYPSIARNSYQGIDKLLSVGGSKYSATRQKVEYNQEYSYKLRVSSSKTQMASIVLYDRLESAESSSWNGIYQGYSLDGMKNAGVDTSQFKVYYSASREQTQDLNASGWVSEESWTQDLTEVKAIAFDLKGYIMQDDDVFYVEILMKAPSSGVEGDSVKNQMTASYVEYDLSDTDLLTPLKVTNNLPSNVISLTLGDAKVDINVKKEWDDNNNNLKIRPESVIVRLLQNGVEIDDAELNQSNSWKYTFSQLLKYDENNVEYEYTLSEDKVMGYQNNITSVVSDTMIDFTVTNSIDEETAYVTISGTKTWDDFDNAYDTRPDSVTIDLYQDDIKIQSTTTSAADDWSYQFAKLPRYRSAGVLYDYSVKENNVNHYEATYSTDVKNNGLAITFDSNSFTEATYDYVIIYYELNGETYQCDFLSGSNIAGKTVKVPSHDFYLQWYTDSSTDNYYGFRIDSVVPTEVDVDSLNATKRNLPSYTVIECTDENYPESIHNGYGNNVRELYHYSYDETLIDKSYGVKNTLVSLPNSRELTVGKKLNVDDIWWDHGNPTFLVEVKGKDAFGNDVLKYVSLAFTKEYVEQNKFVSDNDTLVTMESIVKLPPGTYTVSEIQVLRYNLIGITTVRSDTVTDHNAMFDLKVNDNGECVFFNRCVNYKDFSHNDIIVNQIR